MQETNIQTEALSEEKKVPEESEGAKENEPVVPVPEPIVEAPKGSLIEDVPFTVQAPSGQWGDPVFQNGCEEASLVMAAYWISGKPLTPALAEKEMQALARYEENWLGHSVDTSIEDMGVLLEANYGIASSVEHTDDETLARIREALSEGAIVIVPADGRKLRNPHFTQPGPPRHMLVVIGYDAETKEFITHDPGTKRGERHRYREQVLFEAIRDYPTGDHLPFPEEEHKTMVIIGKS
ncbi:MAG: C39 family peptidase [Patescibacteria group bacterium]